MNILFLIGTYSSFGGTERVTTVLANALQGVRAIAAFREKCEPEKLGLKPAVKCFELGKHPAKALRKILLDEKIDVVINQWCLPFHVTRIVNKARKGLGVKLISALHGVPDRSKRVIVAEDEVNRARGLARWIAAAKLRLMHMVIRASLRYVYRHSDAYVVLSEGFIPAFQNYSGLWQTPRLCAIGNPITIKADPGKLDFAKKKKQILYVGRMDKENKRVNRIIEAWESLFSEYGDWSLVLVGDGPHLQELRQYVAGNRIERVQFAGFVGESLADYYRDASIFMLTSDLEGFGLVLLEAMIFGAVPVVYGSYVAAHDIVDDGREGFVTPTPYSHDETCRKLRLLMDNDELRQRMAANAQKKAEKFTLESVMSKWQQLL